MSADGAAKNNNSPIIATSAKRNTTCTRLLGTRVGHRQTATKATKNAASHTASKTSENVRIPRDAATILGSHSAQKYSGASNWSTTLNYSCKIKSESNIWLLMMGGRYS